MRILSCAREVGVDLVLPNFAQDDKKETLAFTSCVCYAFACVVTHATCCVPWTRVANWLFGHFRVTILPHDWLALAQTLCPAFWLGRGFPSWQPEVTPNTSMGISARQGSMFSCCLAQGARWVGHVPRLPPDFFVQNE